LNPSANLMKIKAQMEFEHRSSRLGESTGRGAAWLLGWWLAFGFHGLAEAANPTLDFNRDIRPILSQNCFLCHGPDEQERKGGLRLDNREGALKADKHGARAVVPGEPSASALVARVTTGDLDDLMPPPQSGKKLTADQIATLRLWVEEGAPYARHWAYTPPTRPALPTTSRPDWASNGLDRFILRRLDEEKLAPSPEAEKTTLLRRVYLDLTGLPPTLAEAEQFMADTSSGAYARMVDRALANPAYGEHWAQLWLDLARYADSAGYADDPARTIWGYRDYVIRAFNSNKPFDQFTIEQLAGDLLENPTEEQLIATAFHRNTMTNNEGGTSDEEFRSAAIVDRVNTTMAVWMGTSMACAQCHTHKYDPITQTEYFSFYAFLNNTEDADRTDETPVVSFFTASQKSKRESLTRRIEEIQGTLEEPTAVLLLSLREWVAGFPTTPATSPLAFSSVAPLATPPVKIGGAGVVEPATVAGKDGYRAEATLEAGVLAGLRLKALPHDSLPAKGPGRGAAGDFEVRKVTARIIPPKGAVLDGAKVRIELPGKQKILSLAEVQVFSLGENIAPKGEASQSSEDFGGAARLAIDGNTNGHFDQARSTTHTKISDNPWWELDFKGVRGIERIVVWNRTDNQLQKRLVDFKISIFDAAGSKIWETASGTVPDPSAEFAVDGSRVLQFVGGYLEGEGGVFQPEALAGSGDKVLWKATQPNGKPQTLTLLAGASVPVAEGSKLELLLEHGGEALGSFSAELIQDGRYAEYVKLPPPLIGMLAKGFDSLGDGERDELRRHYFQNLAPGLAAERGMVAELEKELNGIKPSTVPVLKELAGEKRRATHLQRRGNYLDTGEEVREGVPVELFPYPEDGRRDRLGLAKWLVDRGNPLTARVVVNRFWEQIFGIGLVRTSEEFGSQGEPPSHPELLDWLAMEFMDSGWDVKKLLKEVLLSSTYRQSSKVSPELYERDPDNRLLARGARFRLPAEAIRDQALFVGGLLSGKMLGPSVRPQRPSLGLNAAFGRSMDWTTSDGEDRFRRGVYTEWRRTSPYPSMSTFDAPNREVCTLRRPRTNTPLQALVTLNDPVYLEAAQGLARRMAEGEGTPAERLTRGFQLCLLREPSEAELKVLQRLFASSVETLSAKPEDASRLAGNPPAGVPMAEFAAWTAVGNALLNLDELVMKR